MSAASRLLVACALVAAVAAPAPAAPDNLAGRLAVTVEKHRHAKVRAAVAVFDASTGREIYAYRADKPQRPASVMKLASSAAAFLSFGPDGLIETHVLSSVHPDASGVLDSSLVVRGYGDPGFAARFGDGDPEAALRKLARDLLAAGVSSVTGDLVIDGSAFSDSGRADDWGHRRGQYAWWMAPVSAIVLNDNCIDARVLPGSAPGEPAVLELSPSSTVVPFTNGLKTVADRKQHSILFAAGAGDAVKARGRVWVKSTGYEVSLACVDPLPYFADVFRRVLAEEGVEIHGGTVIHAVAGDGPPEPAATLLLARHGTPVSAVARVCNTRSQNLYAELLLRAVGLRELGDGSASGGARAARALLGFEPEDSSLFQADGSGLSRRSQVTAGAIGRILLRMWRSEHRAQFLDTLAVGGDSEGTLRTRFREKRFEDRVRAKTGTLRDTKCLAGYVRGHDDTAYAFVVLCEGVNWRGQQLADAVVGTLVPR